MSLVKAKQLFEERGYIMTATEYKDSKTPLTYVCPKHPDKDLKITYNKLRLGQGCKYCGYESQSRNKKLTFEEVSKEFEARGYKLLDSEYKGGHNPMCYICPRHPDTPQRISISSLKQRHGCRQCGIEKSVGTKRPCMKEIANKISKTRRTSYSEIKLRFEDRGYTLLTSEDDYRNEDTRMEFICPNHPDLVASVLVATFNRGAGCNFCAIDSHTGEGHWKWNPELTEEDREASRSRHSIPEYVRWVKEVRKKDDFTCQKCYKRGGHLNVHHKDGWNWCEARRYDITNGATLCKECHDDFHNKYGRGNNTEDQFKEWL